ncbi:PH domain-containing protein [Calidifontibacillus erzurumensis]|uniref:PH domain-containing protein n=1 Tax=Calidifontibacillus erzurumensis TaxID=2741433 RepID=A0A8J8GD99_9BACI|nr:PH domain-containing protein [Calidifontibacillus erzurumensis]NSL51419.1 PH domain-containing protein [Calidifontibacillus erzurumensis]
MFKKIAADALGLSDIGSVIKPQDYDKVEADDFVMHEDDEKIYFLIKSKSDEYCFTNRALIHVDGTSAVSKKRMLRRYDYYRNYISNVALETAGTIDLDIEIKFRIGSEDFSIDVHKKHLDELKDLYKALVKISEIQFENDSYINYTNESLNMAVNVLGRAPVGDRRVSEEFKEINEYVFNVLSESKKKYIVKDFGDVFEKYINN